jgi:hypothetical protein
MLLLGAPAGAFQDGNAALLFHSEDAGVLRRWVFVAPGKLSTLFVQQRCARLLEAHPTARVAIVELFENNPDPRGMPGGSAHFGLGDYLWLYDGLAKPNWRTARCLLTPRGGSYVMRLGQVISRGVLYGSEPAVLEADGVRAEVIHLKTGITWDEEKVHGIEAFVLVNRIPSVESATVIAERMRQSLGPMLGRVHLHDEARFAQHEGFPVYPLYAISVRPTSEMDLWKRYFECTFDRQRFRCEYR